MTVDNGSIGYGWLLDATMQENYLGGSGYVFHSLPEPKGLAYCGYRLSVRDLPKGTYLITTGYCSPIPAKPKHRLMMRAAE